MAPQHFEQDGIRVPTTRFALEVGVAVGLALRSLEHQPKVITTKNTAGENYKFEHAVVSGLLDAGIDVIQNGPLPVPALAALVPSMRADLGVFISGGHEGHALLRFVDSRGNEPDEEFRNRVEHLLSVDALAECRELVKLPDRNMRIHDAEGRYIELVKAWVPKGFSFEGTRVLLDCANGSSYKVAPPALHELGFEMVLEGVNPLGDNLELAEACGYRNEKLMRSRMLAMRADFGLALNADADAAHLFTRQDVITVRVLEEDIAHRLTACFGNELRATKDPLVRALLFFYAVKVGNPSS